MTIYGDNFLSKDCSYYDDTCLLVGLTEDGYEYNPSARSILLELYSLSGENFENSVKIDWPKPFLEYEDLDMDGNVDSSEDKDDALFRIMDSTIVNGILCLSTFHHGIWKLILWSPTSNEFKVIPFSPFEAGHFWGGNDVTPPYHLVGHDHIKDDYKVIRFNNINSDEDYDDVNSYDSIDYDAPLNSFWEIYSLSGNYWRQMYVNMPLFSRNKNVYMDGVSHWWDKNKTHTYLVSFDFCNESFTTTHIPSYIDDSFEVNRDFVILRDLVILNGSIAFILNYKKASTIHISILGEIGVKESWTKLFVVGPSPSLNYPIVAAKKGKILLKSRSNKQLVWFDLRTGMIDKIDVTKKHMVVCLVHN
jgi:F-box interacting protein